MPASAGIYVGSFVAGGAGPCREKEPRHRPLNQSRQVGGYPMGGFFCDRDLAKRLGIEGVDVAATLWR